MGLTSAQRYNKRMDKIFEEARRLKKEQKKEWTCEKASLGNNDWECHSQRDTAVSLSGDGSVRFTKFNCDKEVKVDGKTQKGKCGVELI